MALRKHDTVYYTVRGCNFEATILTRHHNGDYTVRATFQIDLQHGNPIGSYLGFKYRMKGSDLTLLEKAPRS